MTRSSTTAPAFDLELQVLGRILCGGAAAFDAAAVKPHHFDTPINQLVVIGIDRCVRAGLEVNAANVVDALPAERQGDAMLLVARALNESGATGADAAHWGSKLRDHHAQRVLRARVPAIISRPHQNGDGVAQDLDALADLTEELRAEIVGKLDLAMCAESAAELWPLEVPPRVSYVGRALLPARDYALTTGFAGCGKTYVMLQKAVAVALGLEWFGIPTTQARVGIIETELDWGDVRERLERVFARFKLTDEQINQAKANLVFLCRDMLPDPFLDLVADWRDVVRWIRKHRLQVVMLDPFDNLHQQSELDLRLVVRSILAIACTTDSALDVLHHERKNLADGAPTKQRKQTRADDLSAARGDSRLISAARVVLRLVDRRDGLRELRAAKITKSAAFTTLYLRQASEGDEAEGTFEVVAEPPDQQQAKQARLDRARPLLEVGCRAEQLVEELGVARGSIYRYLKQLGAVQGPDGLWRLLTGDGAGDDVPGLGLSE